MDSTNHIIDINIFNEGTINTLQQSYTPQINPDIAVDIVNKICDNPEAMGVYLLEKLHQTTITFLLAEIWECKKTNSKLGDVKWFTYPEKKRMKIKFKDLDHLKIQSFEHKFKCISNKISSDPRFLRKKSFKSSKNGKRGLSLPSKIDETKKRTNDTCVLTIPFFVRNDKFMLVLYRHSPFETNDICKLMSYVPLIQKIITLIPNKNASGGTVRRTKERDEVKDTFLATVSHELRTPLNGIVGMISMLRDAGPLTDKQQEYLVILMECSHQLMTMLNNMLDFNKMMSNRLALLRGPFDINACAQDAIVMASGKARAKGLKVEHYIDSNIPIHLIGDSQRFIQILSNLLSNAVKFTENGRITLKITGSQLLSDEYLKKWKIDVVVEDTGIGISKEEQQLIFDGFYQSKNLTGDMMQRGTGLGLSICRKLILMMDGDITVKSKLGEGTVFDFYIVVEEEIRTDSLKNEETVSLLQNAKVMIVDDRAEYRIQITDILFKLGCQPTAVSSGEEVLQHIRYGIKYDTIIVDICMPYMSGIELAQNLIHYEKENSLSHVPLLALSSVELQGGTEIFDIYLNKPIDQNSLFPPLMKCLRANREKKSIQPQDIISGRNSPKIKKDKASLRILIAEDDPNNLYTIKEMLTHLGYSRENITCVVNGEKCVEEAKKRPYDVILMDIIMPVMDGLEATKHIRTIPNHPYIIAVSAAVQNSDKQRCQRVGIDGYLPKPIVKDKLKNVLSRFVE